MFWEYKQRQILVILTQTYSNMWRNLLNMRFFTESVGLMLAESRRLSIAAFSLSLRFSGIYTIMLTSRSPVP